jgi:2Fe-2S ferredoxin
LKHKKGKVFVRRCCENGIDIEHACEMSNSCTTCHVYIRKGFDSLEESGETEDDMLDKAWGLDMQSRLSCQAIVGSEDLEVEIPKYTLNQVSENH